MFAAFLLLAGCSKNDGGSSSNITNQLKGMWSGPEFEVPAYMYATSLSRSCVYDFINNNTVISYGTVDKFQHDYETNKEPLPGHNGWYYLDVNKKTLTYAFEDNKVIMTNGVILTYMDGQLYLDNSSTVLSRW